MIDVNLIGANGTGKGAKVNGEGELSVVVHPHPPIDEEVNALPYRAYFLDGASNDMTIDGSSTSVDFSINASQDFDIYVKSISVIIGDGGSPALNKFGALTALANGVEFVYFNQLLGGYTLHDGIKSNLEFLRLGEPIGFGDSTTAALADVSGGGTEKSYLPNIDMAKSYGLAYGLRLVKGTTDKLIFRINDSLTGLTTMNAIAYGIRI